MQKTFSGSVEKKETTLLLLTPPDKTGGGRERGLCCSEIFETGSSSCQQTYGREEGAEEVLLFSISSLHEGRRSMGKEKTAQIGERNSSSVCYIVTKATGRPRWKIEE